MRKFLLESWRRKPFGFGRHGGFPSNQLGSGLYCLVVHALMSSSISSVSGGWISRILSTGQRNYVSSSKLGAS